MHKQHAAPTTTDLSHKKGVALTPEARRKDRLTTVTKPYVIKHDSGRTPEERRAQSFAANSHVAGTPMGLLAASQDGDNSNAEGEKAQDLGMGTGLAASEQ